MRGALSCKVGGRAIWNAGGIFRLRVRVVLPAGSFILQDYTLDTWYNMCQVCCFLHRYILIPGTWYWYIRTILVLPGKLNDMVYVQYIPGTDWGVYTSGYEDKQQQTGGID